MTVILAGTAVVVPPPPVPPPAPYVDPYSDSVTRMRQALTAGDGTRFTLTDPLSPVRLKQGVRGLSFPPFTARTSSSPAYAGVRFRSTKWEERPVFLPTAVYGQPGQVWVDVDAAFWRILDPAQTVRWSVTTPGGQTRSLDLRFRGDGDHTFSQNPAIAGWASYGLQFAAESPFWRGDPVSRTWQPADPNPPLSFPPTVGGAGGGSYIVYLTSGSTFANAEVTNAGDVESYPVWTLRGPFDQAAVGVGGSRIVVPFSLDGATTAGPAQSVTINTDPAFYSATRETGESVTHLLGETDWASVPSGGSITGLSIEMVGLGSVTMDLPSLYFRAW